MKKILAAVLLTLTASLLLTGCSSKFHGTWKSVAIEEDGKKYTTDDDDYGDMVKDFMTIEIESGGEGTIKISGEDEEDLEWEADGDTITLTVDGDDEDAELEDDQLVLKQDGLKVYLEKDE